MEKIKFGDKMYNLIVNGISLSDEKLVVRVLAGDNTVDMVVKNFSNSINLASISVVSESDELLQSPYIGYTIMESVKLCKGVVLEQVNTVDEDSSLEDVVVDIFEIVLRKPDIRERVSALEEQNNMLMECIMEMSEQIYS